MARGNFVLQVGLMNLLKVFKGQKNNIAGSNSCRILDIFKLLCDQQCNCVCKLGVLRPVYTGDFCGDFSHSDACD